MDLHAEPGPCVAAVARTAAAVAAVARTTTASTDRPPRMAIATHAKARNKNRNGIEVRNLILLRKGSIGLTHLSAM
jgi:hypothetical protein